MYKLIIAIALVYAAIGSAVADQETLQNDGFVSGAPVNFQGGFVAGEIAAARFVPQIPCPCIVESVTLLFGGSSASREMTVLVWDDPGGSPVPGALLSSSVVTLTGSNVNLQLIDLSLAPIIVNGPFRVGLEFGHTGVPSVASDIDGSIDAAANFILADFGALIWFGAATLGVSGDFIIRASIDNLIEDADGDGVSDPSDNCLLVANADQRDTNGDNYGNICDADVTNDCMINFADLNEFKAVFFGNDPDADLNGDGFVNFADLDLVKQSFFGSPGPSGLTTLCD